MVTVSALCKREIKFFVVLIRVRTFWIHHAREVATIYNDHQQHGSNSVGFAHLFGLFHDCILESYFLNLSHYPKFSWKLQVTQALSEISFRR